MKKFAVLALALMLAVVVVPVLAGEAVDEFDYPVGLLNGNNGGTGWSTPWTSGAGISVVAPGLTFPGLMTHYNAAQVTSGVGTGEALRNLSFGYKYAGAGTSSYFSYLVRPDTGFGQWGALMINRTGAIGLYTVEFGLTRNPDLGAPGLYIQQGGLGGLINKGDYAYVANTTYLVRGQLDVTAGGVGTMYAWLYDNDPNLYAPVASATLALSGDWSNSMDNVWLYSAGGYTYDQFRFNDPDPVPEAGTMVALGSFLSMGGLFLRRRFVKS